MCGEENALLLFQYTAGSELAIAVEETDLRITMDSFVKTSSELPWWSKRQI